MGDQRVQPLAAEDGGGNGSQPVAAQLQFLQLLQSGQITAGGGRGLGSDGYKSAGGPPSETGLQWAQCYCGKLRWCGRLPGSEGLQLVVSQVQHSQASMLAQERDAPVGQAVVGQVKLLQAAAAVL